MPLYVLIIRQLNAAADVFESDEILPLLRVLLKG